MHAQKYKYIHTVWDLDIQQQHDVTEWSLKIAKVNNSKMSIQKDL